MLIASERPDVSDIFNPVSDPGEYAFASLMKAREDALHSIFGQPLNGSIRVEIASDLTFNFPGGGVYQYPPRESLPFWHYVTSGLSHPDEPDEETRNTPLMERYSSFGIELVISTPRQADWPVNVLFNLIRYLLFQESARVILPEDRIPCNGPLVVDTDTKLTHLLALRSPDYETEILLPEGRCDLVHLVGVTTPEIQKALTLGKGTAGSTVLTKVLQHFGINTLTIAERDCLTNHAEFESVWNRIQHDCELEWQTNKK